MVGLLGINYYKGTLWSDMMKYLFWLKQLMAAKKHPTPSSPPLLPSKMHYLPKGSRNPSLNPVSSKCQEWGTTCWSNFPLKTKEPRVFGEEQKMQTPSNNIFFKTTKVYLNFTVRLRRPPPPPNGQLFPHRYIW